MWPVQMQPRADSASLLFRRVNPEHHCVPPIAERVERHLDHADDWTLGTRRHEPSGLPIAPRAGLAADNHAGDVGVPQVVDPYPGNDATPTTPLTPKSPITAMLGASIFCSESIELPRELR